MKPKFKKCFPHLNASQQVLQVVPLAILLLRLNFPQSRACVGWGVSGISVHHASFKQQYMMHQGSISAAVIVQDAPVVTFERAALGRGNTKLLVSLDAAGTVALDSCGAMLGIRYSKKTHLSLAYSPLLDISPDATPEAYASHTLLVAV